MVFFHAIEGIFIIIAIVMIGYFLTMKGWFTAENSKVFPKLVNFVALPAYMIWNLTTSFDREKLLAIVYGIEVPFLSMLLCCIIGVIVSNIMHIPLSRRGIFRTVFFCSNTVFIGIPVNLALFGETSLPFVLLYFFVNTCFFWTIGNYFIGRDGMMSDVSFFSLKSLKNLFSPPFIGVLAAIVIIFLGIQLPDFILSTAKYLGGMTTPISLIFIGIVMFGVKIKDLHFDAEVLAILIGRFVISPLMVYFAASLIPIPDLMRKVFVIQSALPAMTQVTIIAKLFEADSKYAALLTAITTLLAALVIPIYMVLL